MRTAFKQRLNAALTKQTEQHEANKAKIAQPYRYSQLPPVQLDLFKNLQDYYGYANRRRSSV